MPRGHTYHSMHFESMNKPRKTVSLSAGQRLALEALCRRRKVEALVWKRARAFLLLDAGYDTKLVCEILDIGPTVLTEWRFAFSGAGLSFFGLKDYSQRQGHLSGEHERALKARFAENPARNVDGVCAYVPAEYGQSYSSPGAAGLMRRLGLSIKSHDCCLHRPMKSNRRRLSPCMRP